LLTPNNEVLTIINKHFTWTQNTGWLGHKSDIHQKTNISNNNNAVKAKIHSATAQKSNVAATLWGRVWQYIQLFSNGLQGW